LQHWITNDQMKYFQVKHSLGQPNEQELRHQNHFSHLQQTDKPKGSKKETRDYLQQGKERERVITLAYESEMDFEISKRISSLKIGFVSFSNSDDKDKVNKME
jgi:hypothetical protein